MKVQGTTIQAVRPLVREIRQGQPASQFQVYAGSTLVGGGVVMTNGAAARQALQQAGSPGGVSAEQAEVFKALGEIAWAVVQHCAGMSMPGYLTKPVGSDIVAPKPVGFSSGPFTPARAAVTGNEMPLTLLRSGLDAAEFLGDYVDYPLPVELGLKVFRLGTALILLVQRTQDHPEAGAGDHARPDAAAIDGAHAAAGAGGGTRPDAGARWSAATGPWGAKALDGAHPDDGARGGGLPSAGVPGGTLVGAGGLGIVGMAGGFAGTLPLAVRFTRPWLSSIATSVASAGPDVACKES